MQHRPVDHPLPTWAIVVLIASASVVILDLAGRAVRFWNDPPHLFNLGIWPFVALGLALLVATRRALRGRSLALLVTGAFYLAWGGASLQAADRFGDDTARPMLLLLAAVGMSAVAIVGWRRAHPPRHPWPPIPDDLP